MSLDAAIIRLQYHAQSSTDVQIRLAPDYPTENAAMLPISLAYFQQGEAQADTADQTRLLLTAYVDIHFPRADLKTTYSRINKSVMEYMRRIAGDPTLNGSIDTVVFPITFQVLPTQWGQVETIMVQFSVQMKTLTTPIT
jgi:hypothetical protein